MKVLHIINSMDMGGAQSLLSDMVKEQKSKGVEIELLQLVQPKDNVLENKVMRANVPVTYLSKGTVYNPFLIFKLIPYLKNYDLIHVHLFPSQYWVGLAKLLCRSKTPMITTEHSTTNKRRNHFILKYFDRFIYRNCFNMVVACAEKALETFKKGFPNSKSMAIPNGVNIKAYSSAVPYTKKQLLNVNEDVFLLGMVARFNYPKRQDMVVKALSFLPKNVHAVFVGGGDYNSVRELAIDLDIEDRIHFLGIRSDVNRILRTVDVVVLSSEYEGLSLSSIEGMSVEKPFVASNVNGLREVVSGAGELFELNDEKAMAEIILKMILDKEYYCSVAKRCMERAKIYDISRMVDKYNKLYKEVMC